VDIKHNSETKALNLIPMVVEQTARGERARENVCCVCVCNNKVGVVEVGVQAVQGNQLAVGALLDYAALVEHEDLIGVADRR